MASRSRPPEHPSDRQAGVSLVEIVVAMFLFAVMSVAILPLLVGAVQASATNRDLVAANTLASAQLASLQIAFPNSAENPCTSVLARAASGIPDPSKSGATASISVGACPSSYPATVSVTVRAFRPNNPSKAVVTLESAVLVSLP